MNLLRRTISSLQQKLQEKEHRGPVYFTASSIMLSVAGLFSTIAITHYISPHDLGLWSSVGLAVVYASLVTAGIQNGLSRELPYYLGAENVDMARKLAATALFYVGGVSLLATLAGGAVVAILIWKHSSHQLIYSIIAITGMIVFRFYQGYLFTTFRSKNSFLDLARVQAWQAGLTMLLLPLLLMGYGGFLFRTVAISALGLYWMHRARPMSITPKWTYDSFRMLFKTGVPIFALDYVANAAGTFDKVALLRFGGVEQLGYYSLALSAYSAFQVVPISIAHYIYPRMSHHYGRTNNPRVLWGMAWRVNLIVLAAMIPLAVIGFFLMPTTVRILFPKYIAGTRAAQIALFAAAVSGASTGVNALLSMKAWSYLIVYQLSFAILFIAAPFIGIRMFSSPLTGVALGVLGASVISAAIGLAVTFQATRRRSILPEGADPVGSDAKLEITNPQSQEVP